MRRKAERRCYGLLRASPGRRYAFFMFTSRNIWPPSDVERRKMHKLLNQYLLTLGRLGSQACKVWVEMDSVEEGIIQVISQYNVRRLVMAAAADDHCTEKLSEKSKKAAFVCKQAPVSCHIWFVCCGHLIYARCGNYISTSWSTMTLPSSTSTRGVKLLHEDADGDPNGPEGTSMGPTSQDVVFLTQSAEEAMTLPSSIATSGIKLLHEDADGDPNGTEGTSMGLTSEDVLFSTQSAEEAITLPSSPSTSSIKLLHEDVNGVPHGPEGTSMGLTSQDMLFSTQSAEEAMTLPSLTSTSRIKLIHEDADGVPNGPKGTSMGLTSQDVVFSTQLGKEVGERSEILNNTKQRRELEKTLDWQKQELEKMKDQHKEHIKELQMFRDKKLELESLLMKSRCMEEELEEKIIQAVNLLVTFKEKRDKLKIESGNVIAQIKELRKSVVVDSSLRFLEFSFWEINEATRDFDPAWKIGDGRYGSVYKGFLHHLKVAIKMLPSHGSESPMVFENKAHFLSKIRHPNLVTLIGTCPESQSLIYEYLENGSLEDHLICREKTAPLLWQTRIKIASEICSALIFLHSNKPSVVHGNLKPTNILLDSNFVSKISHMGIYCFIPNDIRMNHLTSLCKGTDLEASAYVAVEVFESGEVTQESDVFSFGVVLLRLLTGRPAVGVLKDVKCALERDNFNAVLDLAAGKWPIEKAKNLARLALRCCEHKQENRANLVYALSEIELVKESCDALDLEAKGTRRVPSHFVCPIFQEIMKDPHIVADGYTYEGDAIRGWFNSGHKTSPMTNLKLENCDLLPNYALYHAIQEWEQQ